MNRDQKSENHLGGDILGGLASMLVALPSSVAFGIVVYSSLGPEFSGRGAMAGLVGAAVLGLVNPFIGRTKGLISSPCAPSAAVLSAFVAAMVTGVHGISSEYSQLKPEEIISLISVTAVLGGLLQTGYGLVGGGKLIKFIPYQVVSGYLSGVGVLIALSQLPKWLGIKGGKALWQGLLSPEAWQWPGVMVGLVTIFVMVIGPKLTTRIPAAIMGLLAGLMAYGGLSLFWPELRVLSDNPLIIGPLQTTGSLIQVAAHQLSSLTQVRWDSIRQTIVPALTLSVLLSIDTLKTCVALDAITLTRHNSNRELIGQGIGNFLASVIGGMPGAGGMGPTLVNISSGGKTPRAGVFEGVFVLLALLFLSPFISWVPVAALSGILLVIAWRMFDRGIFKLLKHRSGLLDFAVIVGVIFVAVFVDLIAASGFGVILSILLFVRDKIKENILLEKTDLTQVSSKTQRTPAERAIINEFGKAAVICRLQGNLFFGTTDQLYTRIESDLKNAQFLLLDMRRVQSLDYTAVHLFDQMNQQLKKSLGQLLFSGMPSGLYDRRDFEKYLAHMGLIGSQNGAKIFDTFDSALEFMEDTLIKVHSHKTIEKTEGALSLSDFNLFREFDQRELTEIQKCIQEKALSPGEMVFRHGDSGDELFLVRSGKIKILLPLSGGKHHHVATVQRGGFFGELAFLDKGTRAADVIVEEASQIFIFSRPRFNELSRKNPELGAQFFGRLALAIGERLRAADAELRSLEER